MSETVNRQDSIILRKKHWLAYVMVSKSIWIKYVPRCFQQVHKDTRHRQFCHEVLLSILLAMRGLPSRSRAAPAALTTPFAFTLRLQLVLESKRIFHGNKNVSSYSRIFSCGKMFGRYLILIDSFDFIRLQCHRLL